MIPKCPVFILLSPSAHLLICPQCLLLKGFSSLPTQAPQPRDRHRIETGMSDWIFNGACPPDSRSHPLFTWVPRRSEKTSFSRSTNSYWVFSVEQLWCYVLPASTQQEDDNILFLHCCTRSNIICHRNSSVRKLGDKVTYMWVHCDGLTAFMCIVKRWLSESHPVPAFTFALLRACIQNGHKQNVLHLQPAPHMESWTFLHNYKRY